MLMQFELPNDHGRPPVLECVRRNG